MRPFEEKIQKGFWYTGLAVSFMSLLILGITRYVMKIEIMRLLPGCMFRERFGFYCPGCGGTRAVIQLMHGCLWKSFCLHPVVPYAAVIFMLFMATSTVYYVFGYDRRFLLRPIYLYITPGIIVIQWILKNIFIEML